MIPIDHIDADRYSPLGDSPVIVVDVADYTPSSVGLQAVVIGIDADGRTPAINPAEFDVLLTSAANPPRPWISIEARSPAAAAHDLATTVLQWPLASAILCQTLRINEKLATHDAVLVESLAYSALLGGREFAQWKRQSRPSVATPTPDGPVLTAREGDHITLTLNDPDGRNAMTAVMRDALYAALANVADDPSCPTVTINAVGRCFSTGGALHEFGTTPDLATAHAARTLHSCGRIISDLGKRVTVMLHGACIGSGIEVAAAAAQRIASTDAWFQLPELRMGLIPGAGGTVGVARAVGRHRCAWMVLSGKRISARTGQRWGLIHHIADQP